MDNVIKKEMVKEGLIYKDDNDLIRRLEERIAIKCGIILEDTDYNELERIAYAKACMDILQIIQYEVKQ